MKHPESTTRVLELSPGFVLSADDGPVVLATGPLHPDGEGSFAYRVCMLIMPGKDFQPFTVHNVFYDDERERWGLQTGDYAQTIEEAAAYFTARTGQEASTT